MQLDELGQRIRSRREKMGLKQQDIANALRLSPQAVSKWERGENAPDIAVLIPLARLLGVSTDWLLDSTEGQQDMFEATVFVSDVRGTYERSRRMDARSFAIWANGMFFSLTELALCHGGVPIKYLGDQFLCFFTGARHAMRGLETAFDAVETVGDELVVSINRGEIYLGTVGHPDYARPDIMGEAVNVTFLTRMWAESHSARGVVATGDVLDVCEAKFTSNLLEEVSFDGLDAPVALYEVTRAEEKEG